VVSVSGSVVTIFFPQTVGSPTNWNGITAGTLTPITTILTVAGNIQAINISQPGIGAINNILLIGPGASNTNSGVYCDGGVSNFTLFGVTGFANGVAGVVAGVFAVNNAIVNMTNCSAIANQGDGLANTFGSIFNLVNCYCSYNFVGGTSSGSGLHASATVIGGGFIQNAHAGISVYAHGVINMTGTIVTFNSLNGVEVASHGYGGIAVSVLESNNRANTGNFDLFASGLSFVDTISGGSSQIGTSGTATGGLIN
jgi:hypothetical protein